jgi:Short C-terminal domain
LGREKKKWKMRPGVAEIVELLSEERNKVRTMKKQKPLMLSGSLILAGLLSGCSFRGGDETTIQTRATTTGQELQDLKAAYDKGIISEREFNQQKEKLLRGQSADASSASTSFTPGQLFERSRTQLTLCVSLT